MKHLILIFAIFLYAPISFAQTEQISMESDTETMDTTRFDKIVESYNRIIRAQEEKLRLFKIDLIGPSLYLVSNWEEKDNAQNRLVNLAYEQKIKPNWSWILEGSFKADREDFQELQGGAGARYYYNMNNRIMKGKSANNFSGNYFSAVFNYGHQYQNESDQTALKILYGFQRRLGKHWFIDANIGFENIFSAYEGGEKGTDFYGSIKWGLAF